MQTIVKVFIAIIFSHLSVSGTSEETNTKKEKVHASLKIQISDCATLTDHDYLYLS